MNTKRLYRYFDAKAGRLTLDKCSIKVTPPSQFNDPLEFSPVVRTHNPQAYAKKKMEKLGTRAHFEAIRDQLPAGTTWNVYRRTCHNKKSTLLRHLANAMPRLDLSFQKDVLPMISKKWGVICFSGNPTDPLMWAHYADKHRGIIIEFNGDDELFDSPNIYEVEYKDDRVVYDPMGSDNQKVLGDLAARKSPHWSYEEESRLIVKLEEATRLPITDPEGNPIWVLSIEPSLIKSVTLGLRCNKSLGNEYEKLEAVLDSPPYKNIPVYRIKADDNKFLLHQDPIR